MTAAITSKTDRRELEVRREPHWSSLGKGRALGFRRMTEASEGTWIARICLPHPEGASRRKHSYQKLRDPLGNPVDSYTAAKNAAEAWFKQIASGARSAPVRGTVRDALNAYLEYLRKHGRDSAAVENEARFKLTIYDERIASKRLDAVTRDDFEGWRENLRSGREPRSINRHVRSVAAALTRATKLGHIGNKAAWTLDALTDDVEDSGEAAVFLEPDQRERLIGKAAPALRSYLRGLQYSGARPSELAVATVADFDKVHGTLTLRHRKGRPAKLRARAVGLDDAAVDFFTAQTRGKAPNAPLIANGGAHWRRHEWARGIRAAIEAANSKLKPNAAARIPGGASAYSFRHARISELLQVGRVDPLTVAQQTGTSLAMMEKYYFKLVPKELRDKLNAMAAA